jgi:hypothetical protein
MAKGMKVAGWDLDLQALHACGADCGGPLADAWLAYRPGRRESHAGTIYDRVRKLHARLGRRVLPGDLASEYQSTDVYRREDEALVQRRIAATPRTLPVGPAPLPVDVPCAAEKSQPPPKVNRASQRRQYGAAPTVSTDAKSESPTWTPAAGKAQTFRVRVAPYAWQRRAAKPRFALPRDEAVRDARQIKRLRERLQVWRLRVHALENLLTQWGVA